MDKSITIDGVEYPIKKIALGQYAKLMSALQKLPKLFMGFANKKTDEILEMIPNMLTESKDELLTVISIASGIPIEVVDQKMGLDDLSEVLVNFLEVNNFEKIKKNFTVMLKLKAAQSPELPQTGNTGS